MTAFFFKFIIFSFLFFLPLFFILALYLFYKHKLYFCQKKRKFCLFVLRCDEEETNIRIEVIKKSQKKSYINKQKCFLLI